VTSAHFFEAVTHNLHAVEQEGEAACQRDDFNDTHIELSFLSHIVASGQLRAIRSDVDRVC
jgi:hypothetical protein